MIIIFFYKRFPRNTKKKKYYHKKKTVITFHFFYLENCHFSAFESQKMQKLSPPGILSLHFCPNIFIFRASILEKKIYQFEKLSETDFRIRLVESQNHGIQQFFFGITENRLLQKP